MINSFRQLLLDLIVLLLCSFAPFDDFNDRTRKRRYNCSCMIIVQIKVLMTISATTKELCKAMATTVANSIGTSRMVIKRGWNKNKTRKYNYLRAAICSEYAKQPNGTSSVRVLTAYATHAASASINANINNNYSGASAPSEVAICATSKVNPSPVPKKNKNRNRNQSKYHTSLQRFPNYIGSPRFSPIQIVANCRSFVIKLKAFLALLRIHSFTLFSVQQFHTCWLFDSWLNVTSPTAI